MEEAALKSQPAFELYDALDDAVSVQDLTGAIVYANAAAVRLMGFASLDALLAAPIDEVVKRFRMFDEDGEPFPRERLPGRLALQGLTPPETLVRWRVNGSEDERWTIIEARPLLDDHGEVRFAVNVFRDITDQRRAQEEIAMRVRQQAAVSQLGHRALTPITFEELMQEAAELVASTLDVEFAEVLELLPHGEALRLVAGMGWKDGLVGTSTVGAGASSQAGYTLLSRSPVIVENLPAEVRFSGPPLLHDHGVVSGLTVPIPGRSRPFGVLGAHTGRARQFTKDDIHFMEAVGNVLATAIERKVSDEARLELLEAERRSRAQVEEARARVSFLAEASEVLSMSLDPEKTMQRVADLAVPRLADWCAVDVVDDEGELTQAAVAHSDPSMVEWAREFRRRFPPRRGHHIGAANVIRTGEPELYEEVTDELQRQVAQDEEHLIELQKLQPRSAMVVPLTARGRTYGALTFVSTESGRRFGLEDLSLAQDLGRRSALAIDNAMLFRERSRIARTLQRSLLPPGLPEVKGLRAAARYRSAGEGTDVGGDFYDLFPLRDGSWLALIGDVCGRGIDAAALTGLARQTLRAIGSRERWPSAILRGLNEALIPQAGDLRFCTAAVVRIDRDGDRTHIMVSVGGHPLPMILRANGVVEPIGIPGTLLGVFDAPELADAKAELAPGDALVLFTDGVTDPFEAADVPAESGMANLLRPLAAKDAEEIAEGLERQVVATRSAPSRDDMAILVLGVTSE